MASVKRGSAVLLTGHNGSGKTTLLRVLATAVRPSHGRVDVLGVDATAEPERVRWQMEVFRIADERTGDE